MMSIFTATSHHVVCKHQSTADIVINTVHYSFYLLSLYVKSCNRQKKAASIILFFSFFYHVRS